MVRRGELTEALANAVFVAEPGRAHVVRQADARTITLVHVFARQAALLDDATRELIADELFAAWLVERRAGATIEWNWGQSARTKLEREG
jgi:hypothetical protein